jgi:ferredoxin-NADP reductase
VGDRLRVNAPRNHFALDERAGQSVLYYCARSRGRAAFFKALRREISTAPGAVLVPVFDDESGVASLDVRSVVSRHPGAHFYCCGPEPLMQTFVSACEAMEPGRVHIEYFGAPAPTRTVPDAPGSGSKAFSVRLARSNLTLEVRPNTSILDALLERGITVFNSCRQGICGSCETAVLAGKPVHRDRVLSPAERAANTSMMLCVSRCEDDSLVLDL